jgi:pimeloyl-ACP methyl ester carboxylesterase
LAVFFLHGLDSSSRGNKAVWFRDHFPIMQIPDFTGSLDERMAKLTDLLDGQELHVLIGSSFGGLMATIYALENEGRVQRMFLLAPALNFPDFLSYAGWKTDVPVHLFIGMQDDVCPPEAVLPRARQVFSRLTVHTFDDDHSLRGTFSRIDWMKLLPSTIPPNGPCPD